MKIKTIIREVRETVLLRRQEWGVQKAFVSDQHMCS